MYIVHYEFSFNLTDFMRTFIYLFIVCLFKDTVSNADCIASNYRGINEQWIRRDLEASGHDHIWGVFPALVAQLG
jgi:hypothetical protein